MYHYNNTERPGMEELLIHLYNDQYVKVDSAGLVPDQINDIICKQIKADDNEPLRPIATVIEGGSDFKGLLSEGIEEGEVPRKWSLWKQIDPIALVEGKVIPGQPDYAASYNNNVFVFSSEENLAKFIRTPQICFEQRPFMPQIYRTLMVGAKGCGKHTQAKKLS